MADIGERLGGDDIHFSIDQPLRVIIGGPPHSGKSTLMNLLEDRFRYYQIPVELLDLDLASPTPLKTGFTEQREKRNWTPTLAKEARAMFEEAEGVQVVLGDSVGLITDINEIISQPADVAILLVSGGHGDYDTTYRKVVRKWKEYYEDIHKPLLVVLRSTMNPADESMFDPQDNYGVIVGMDRDAYDQRLISGHYRYEGTYPTNACLEGIVFEIAQSFDMKVRSATDPEHLEILNAKWPELKDKKTWTPPEGSVMGGLENAYYDERGIVPADQRAESFAAPTTYMKQGFLIEKQGYQRSGSYYIIKGENKIRLDYDRRVSSGNPSAREWPYDYGEQDEFISRGRFSTLQEALNWFDEQIEGGRVFKDWSAESFSAETCREGCGNEIHCVDCRLCGDCHATGSMCKDCREDICPKDVNAWQLNDKSWLCYDCQHNYPESHESFGADSFDLETHSGHEVQWDDGSFYMTFKEPIDGYGEANGHWYGGERESPDEITLDVEPAWDEETDEEYDVPSLHIQVNQVEYYGIKNHNMSVSPDGVASPELLDAIQEGLAWMVADHADKTVVSREYRGESFSADMTQEDLESFGADEGRTMADDDGRCVRCGSNAGFDYEGGCFTCLDVSSQKMPVNAEDDLTFREWADQEMITHSGKESFDDWLDDELSHHGDNVSLHDWGNHELDSHYERYGAENMTRFEIMPSVDVEGIGIVSGPLVREYSYLTGGRIDNYDIYDDDAAEEIMSIPANDPRFPLQEGELELIEAMVYGFNHPRINDSWGELNEDGMFWATKVMETLSHYQAYAAEMANWSGRPKTSKPYRGLESKTRKRIKQEAAYSQMMIASLIGLGAGLWGVSKWRDSQRSL